MTEDEARSRSELVEESRRLRARVAELEREAGLASRIAETSPVGIVQVDRRGAIVFANRRAEEILGLTRSEITVRRYNDPKWRITDLHGGPYPDEELPFALVQTTRRPVFDVQHGIEWPDGRRVLLSVNAGPLIDDDGEFSGMVAAVEDITERRRLQEQLREAEKVATVASLVASVAHEIRNPLFALSATLDAFEGRHGEREGFSRYLAPLREQLDRVSALTRELVEYGSPQEPALTRQPLLPVLERAAEPCRRAAGSPRKVEIRVDVARGLPEVAADAQRLGHAFENVILNAIEHSPEGGVVEVKATQAGKGEARLVECVVRDSGPGFPAEDIPRVFEPFFTRRRGRVGLGLAIAWRIVREHKGSIGAANAPGGGAVVTIRLPIKGPA